MPPAMENTPNARQRSQEATRQRLIEAGARLFAESGSINTRTSDIARTAGVAVGTMYLHFKDKDALLKDVLRLALNGLKQELAKSDPSQTVGEEQVRAKMKGLAAFADRQPGLAAVLFDGHNLASGAGREAWDFLIKSQEQSLVAGIAAGLYRGDLHTGLAARAQVGMMVQVLGWYARNPEAVNREAVAEVLTETRLHGLQPRPDR